MSLEETRRTQTRKKAFLQRRARMMQAIRRFFIERDYLEVETPCLIPAPAPEVHIDVPSCGGWFLQPSPELTMKRLLAAGHPRIFQICKCFRKGERGAQHLPEFTMLEWYHAGIDYLALMEECEELLTFVFRELGYGPGLAYQGHEVGLSLPWERITVEEAFSLYAPLSLSDCLGDDCFDQVMVSRIEPRLGLVTPTFIHDYPRHPGSLARAKKDNPHREERFELYLAGLELANAFSELTDEQEQRRRFRDAEEARRARGKDPYPPAERFLTSLSQMPKAAGIALGVDRLAMIVTDQPSIDQVVAFVPEDL